MMNSVEFEESFFAIAKLGAVIVPLNWRLVPDELAFILADSGTTVLVYGQEFAAAVAELHERGDDTSVARVGPGRRRGTGLGDRLRHRSTAPRRPTRSRSRRRPTTCCTSCTPRARPACRRG